MEQYRREINALFNRVTNIHEKEFEVLPAAWNKLQNAAGWFAKFTSPYQEYPDLNSMTENQIEEILVNPLLPHPLGCIPTPPPPDTPAARAG